MLNSHRVTILHATVLLLVISLLLGCGGLSSSGGAGNGGGTKTTVPPTPSGLTATAANAQVSLSWSASTSATRYNVKRSTTSGGPYSTLSSPTATTYADTSVSNATKYFYVVSAVNSAGESANSAEISATPTAPQTPPP